MQTPRFTHAFRNPLRRIPRIAEWLHELSANRQSRELHKHYEPLIAEAIEKKDWNKRDELYAEWAQEDALLLDPIRAEKTERLAAKARHYGITVPSRPTSYAEESEFWYPTNTGEWLIHRDSEQRLRREVRAEQRASYEEFRKWATVSFACLAFILGLISLLMKSKQPDPRPRNYYRSDSGACVFASQEPKVSDKAMAPSHQYSPGAGPNVQEP